MHLFPLSTHVEVNRHRKRQAFQHRPALHERLVADSRRPDPVLQCCGAHACDCSREERQTAALQRLSWDEVKAGVGSVLGGPVAAEVTDEGAPPELAALLPGGGTAWQELNAVLMGRARCLLSLMGVQTFAHAVPELLKKKNGTEVVHYLIEVGLFAGLLQSDNLSHCIPRDWILIAARWHLKDMPLALAHFDHYLQGSGTDYVEDLPALFAQDDTFKLEVEERIADNGVLSGDLQIKQESYSNKDWQYALGAIDHLFYEVQSSTADDTAMVRLRLLDPYQWHPAEYGRGSAESRPVHVAAELAKETGAKEFNEVGTAIIELRVGKAVASRLKGH